MQLDGVLPILQTPFHDDNTIDWKTLQREIDWAFESGVTGVCAAMVSELLKFTIAERLEYTEQMIAAAAGRGPVIVSVSSESLLQTLELTRHAERSGSAAIMAIPPLSTALPESALWEFFSQLARVTELPLIVQDASSYVGNAIPISFYGRLLEEFGPEKILFKPEAAPIGPNLSLLREQTGGKARIFDGSGGIFLVDCYRGGLIGTMPGCDLIPAIVALWHALQAGDRAVIDRIYFPLCALVALQWQAGLDGFLEIEKYLLVKQNIFLTTRRRAPVAWQLDPETAQEVDHLYECLRSAVLKTGGCWKTGEVMTS